eukprot:TRINITY_DN994_c0_g2_i1.p2 TRINITY_DN994_c0_g2~~TRINITY_DN994_c0_g2_i1.p2  ORF type:complete len:344 (-),score=91.01 TRINITY_DN994_c0_g2_i1:1315-2346(-)
MEEKADEQMETIVAFEKISQLKHSATYFSIGTQWNDVMMSSSKMMRMKSEWKKRKIQFGMMIEPFTNINSSIPFFSTSPPVCNHCSSSFNLYSSQFCPENAVQNIFWECCVCNELNEWIQSSNNDFNQWNLDLLNLDSTVRSETIEYLDSSSSSSPSSVFNNSFERIFFFVVDLNLSSTFQSKIRESILSCIQQMDPEDKICLMSFSNVVSVYHLNTNFSTSQLNTSQSLPISATIFPGIRTGSIQEMSERTFVEFPIVVKECSDQLKRALEIIEKSCERDNAANMRCLGSAIETGLRIMNLLRKGRGNQTVPYRLFQKTSCKLQKKRKSLILLNNQNSFFQS